MSTTQPEDGRVAKTGDSETDNANQSVMGYRRDNYEGHKQQRGRSHGDLLCPEQLITPQS
jgi:hypothetical protein